MTSQVKISASALETMPKFRQDDLSRFVLNLVDLVFSRPGEEEKYQAWLKEREQRKKNTLEVFE